MIKFLNNSKADKIDLIKSSFTKMHDVLDINCINNAEIDEGRKKLNEACFWIIKGIEKGD